MLSNKTFEKISSIGKKHWDECANNENPFLSYTFLKNLEDSKSIGPGTSWMAKYLCIYNNRPHMVTSKPSALIFYQGLNQIQNNCMVYKE